MLISLQWIRDFVNLPTDLDPRDLAERVTVSTAEVEGVTPIHIDAQGLIAAKVISATEVPKKRNLKLVELEIGGDNTVRTATAAPVLHVGSNVVFAPVGASVATTGVIKATTIAGAPSEGMILPGEALGIPLAMQEAVFLGDEFQPGQALPAKLFEDWVIEIDNKSITHRPDLWGHYGMAREIAAIFGLPLSSYPITPEAELSSSNLPDVAITIADAHACRRFTALRLEGVPTIPAPLWMQLRIGRIGMRPISGLVDLTNYVMADLGQPMHAFDADHVPDIEVNWAYEGETLQTLDGMERTLTTESLVVQSQGKSLSLAGVMGGLNTEVVDSTDSLLLESANWDPIVIRRTAHRLSLRTDAAARFEKSLDPANTTQSIQRFHLLAKAMYPEMKITGRLSDNYPGKPEPVVVAVNPQHVKRTLGRSCNLEEAINLLSPLGFSIEQNGDAWYVNVPSFRATGDVSIEADVIEEIIRRVGFDAVEPSMPRVSMRDIKMNPMHELEMRSLEFFCLAERFHEVNSYIWYATDWLKQLGMEAGDCIELRNPAAEGLHQLRRLMMPGMLAAVQRNRFHFSSFNLMDLGSVFEPHPQGDQEHRHLALVSARRGKKEENACLSQIKRAIGQWAWLRFGQQVTYTSASVLAECPWENPHRTATVALGDTIVGRVSVVEPGTRRAMDEHLSAWSIACAELRLDNLASLTTTTEKLGTIPDHPQIDMDFSILVPASSHYEAIAGQIAGFEHNLLKQIRYVDSYEGKSVGEGNRSLTFRTVIGSQARTLSEGDANGFQQAFETFVTKLGFAIRK